MDQLIDNSQSTFIKRRYMIDSMVYSGDYSLDQISS